MLVVKQIKEIFRYRELIHSFVSRDLKLRYRGSVLGFLWSFLDPLLNTAVLWFVFSFIFSRGRENFHIFLLIGVLPWTFFSTSVVQGMGSIVGRGGLIKKIHLPREVFPLSVVISNFIHFIFALVILAFLLFLASVPIDIGPLFFFPLILILSTIFNLGAAFFCSAIGVYFRDLPHVIQSFLRLLYFGTPVFYPLEMVPERFRDLYLLNPLAAVVTSYRRIFLEGSMPEVGILAWLVCSSVLSLLLGWFIFNRLQRGFAEEI